MSIKIERFEKFDNDNFIGTIFKVILNDLLIYESPSKKAAIEFTNQIKTGSLYDAIYAITKRELGAKYIKKLKDNEIRFQKEKENLKNQIAQQEINYEKLRKQLDKFKKLPEKLDELKKIREQLDELKIYQEFATSNFDINIKRNFIFESFSIEVSAFSGIKIQNYYREQVRKKYSEFLTDDELYEFRKLLEYFSKKNLHSSAELSNLIAHDNNLKNKFPNLTGLIQMQDRTNTWMYNGGIHPKIYKFICEELKLENNRSQAIPTGFRSYNDLDSTP
ncbi:MULTISPECIES: hypothetical protein [unclassified Neisseria]|jgi:cold-shock protein DNA-binding protein|nr:hypothetical protein HMPREF3156_00505 [Neisseria sp. HMSC06F02]OFS02017.1 hypothetical protein HMPREF2954_06445 [Neisseria sp. HMSC067H09]